MMFVCFVHVDQALMDAMTPAEREVFDRENREYGEWLDRGPSIVSSALTEPGTARLIRSRNGDMSMIDGPYVETKEHLAGVIVIRAKDRDEAVAIAARCPVATASHRRRQAQVRRCSFAD